jgi:hypothetical protein
MTPFGITFALAVLAGCPAKDRAAPTVDAGTPDTGNVAAPPPVAPPSATVARSASVTRAAVDGGPLLDAPPWPAGTKKMRLTWVVYATVMRNNLPTRRIELVIRAGDVVRRLSTEARGSVFYATVMQPDCSRTPGQIKDARLYMNGGGNTELVADRHGEELWLSEEDSSDGLCDPSPCPVVSTLLGRMAVPSEVTFDERFHIVESAGDEHDESCAPP